MKVAIHQPNYLPWIGFFYKMWLSNSFVFLDHVGLNKSGLTRRTFISVNREWGKCYLTVPLKSYKNGTAISELQIDHSKNWADYHFARLYQLYHKKPFASKYMPKIKSWYNEAPKFKTLASWNIFLISEIAEQLDLSPKTYLSSGLILRSTKDEMNAEIVNLVGGNVYISGKTGSIYRNDLAFIERNLVVEKTDFLQCLTNRSNYSQHFDPNVSIVDALFNIGEEEIIELFQSCIPLRTTLTPLGRGG